MKYKLLCLTAILFFAPFSAIADIDCQALLEDQHQSASNYYGASLPPIEMVAEFRVVTSVGTVQPFAAMFLFQGLEFWYSSYIPFSQSCSFGAGVVRQDEDFTKILGSVTPIEGEAKFFQGQLIPWPLSESGDLDTGYWWLTQLDGDPTWWGHYGLFSPEQWDCNWLQALNSEGNFNSKELRTIQKRGTSMIEKGSAPKKIYKKIAKRIAE